MSNFIDLPFAVLVEYMHLCLEGYGKRQLDYFFNSKYHHNAFYLNNHIFQIDNLLKKVKYTSAFARTQRSITFHNLFKANEYRNLYFYSLIYILKDILEHTYYEHFLQYILFLRILTKDLISNDEIEYSRYLISKYIQEFETLYGSKLLKYNLHAHLHLPDQVAGFGSLNKSSAFCGEGAFKMFDQEFNGTVNIANQIVNNLHLKIENNKHFSKAEIDKIKDIEFKDFASKLYDLKHTYSIENSPKFTDRIINRLSFEQLPHDEQEMFLLHNIDQNETIEQASKIKFKRKCTDILFV
jgi:hypothetical protein